MALNIIDFSNGIRPEEIQENFEYLQAQLSRERLSVGGSGISSGLDVTFNITNDNFDVIVSNGSIIDIEGNEIFVEGNTFEVELPEAEQYEEHCVLDENRTVTLKHIPYATNRRMPSEFLSSYEPEFSGIKIRYNNSPNKDDYIRVRDIKKNVVTVTGALKRDLIVNYYYSGDRIDILYVDANYEVKYKKISQGITSTTPSVPILPKDVKYLIAFIEIVSEYVDEKDPIPHAWMYIKNDLRSIRNLYTDSNGTLYICNIPFDDLQIIHLKEPEDPKENTLWLNLMDNTLYCWRSIDDFSYKNSMTITTDFLENIDYADLTFSTDMSFTIGEHELSVYLNREKLSLGIDYEEVGVDLPTLAGNEGLENKRGNVFQILQTLKRPDEYEDILIAGDVLTYIIRYKDGQYMWVPVNKANYVNAKNTKVFSTYYNGIDDKYLVLEKNTNGVFKAYFDSTIANDLGKDPVTNYPCKYQYFIFDRIEDMNMHFTPGKNELSIMINQMYLHEDQYKEITVYDLLDKHSGIPESVRTAAAVHFGWTQDYLEKNFNSNTGNIYDNSGIGFMLLDPLDSGAKADTIGLSYADKQGSNDLFVEAIVERRICATPLNRKMERSATFVLEDTITLDKENHSEILETKVIQLQDVKYRYDEHQLEVFINGIKQIEGQDYIEEFGFFKQINNNDGSVSIIEIAPIEEDEEYIDQDYFIRKKASVCTKFKFLDHKTIAEGTTITYRITTNIYSYDHINNIIDEIGDTLTSCKNIVETSKKLINDLRSDLDIELNAMDDRITRFENTTGEYLTTSSILNTGQMPPWMVRNAIKSLEHINTKLDLNQFEMKDGEMKLKTEYELDDIYEEDYVNVIHHKHNSKDDSYTDCCLIDGLHYTILTNSENKVVIRLAPEFVFDSNGHDSLYFSGLKIATANREIDN